MAPKQPHRPVLEMAVATTDWSRSIFDDRYRYALGGAGWVRFGQCVRPSTNRIIIGELAATSSWLGVRSFTANHVSTPPVFFMQRYMDQKVVEMVTRAVRNGQAIINDVDDWFWGLHDENQAKKLVDPKLNPLSNTDHYRATLEASTSVTASTPFLVERLKEWGLTVHLVENHVSSHLFPMRKHRDGIPVVGWAGSTAHRSGDLKVLQKPFEKLAKVCRFHHTGHHGSHVPFSAQVGVENSLVSTSPLVAPSQYPNYLNFDIGVIPLSKIEFNDAKSWIKGIEYAAAGIPFVASPSAEYVRLQKQYGVGRLAKNAKEWVDHIMELTDPEVRHEESNRQRQVVEKEFEVKKMARRWDEIARNPFVSLT